MRTGASAAGGAEVLFEQMRRRHLPAVLRIEHKAHPKAWSLGVFTSELAQGDERYYVVLRVGGRVAGYGGLMFVADEAHVTNLAVAGALRRQVTDDEPAWSLSWSSIPPEQGPPPVARVWL